MSVPAHGRLIPISKINESHIGEKLRLFGLLRLAENDTTETFAVLYPVSGEKRGKGILVDLSLPIMDINASGSTLLRESGTAVMVMGSLEQNMVRVQLRYHLNTQ